MGFIGKMVAKALVKKAGDMAMTGVVDHMEKTRSVDALLQNNKCKYKLLIKRKSFSYKRGFTVLDEFQSKKYIIKTDALTFGHPSIRLYDLDENEIGRVQAEQTHATKSSMGTYLIYLDDEKLGRLNRKMSVKTKLEVDFNGWHLDGNLMQDHFCVYDKSEKLIMQINYAFSSKDTYVLEMHNRENEIMGLLLLMAVEIALHGDD